ncbi:MAG: hypothetical protein FWB88_08650 [Defluviitaleaceae bacterium]|nr:hypothetical protein [Defluviitaleaceae bacterium]MCL2240049.1 hypothetical protein [Defluviitaleaceae bacterium]
MEKLKFLLRCLRALSPAKFLRTAREIARESNRAVFIIVLDLLWCAVRYGAGHTDYRNMGFASMPGWRRKTFVTRGVNNDYIRRLNRREDYAKLEDKTQFNTIFADCIGRGWLCLKTAGPEAFIAFAQKYPLLIAKPVDKLCGQGIEKVEITEETDIPALYGRLVAKGQLLVEECVTQHPQLAALYPHSVNTLRLVTLRAGDAASTVHIIFRVLRTGAFGNVVDNTDMGGLVAFTNEAGQIITEAFNYAGTRFPAHPDTGVAFQGMDIPFYAQAEALVKKAALRIPGIRYAGWDVAITETGPLLIEANHNPAHSAYQTIAFMRPGEPGKRPLFKKILQA